MVEELRWLLPRLSHSPRRPHTTLPSAYTSKRINGGGRRSLPYNDRMITSAMAALRSTRHLLSNVITLQAQRAINFQPLASHSGPMEILGFAQGIRADPGCQLRFP